MERSYDCRLPWFDGNGSTFASSVPEGQWLGLGMSLAVWRFGSLAIFDGTTRSKTDGHGQPCMADWHSVTTRCSSQLASRITTGGGQCWAGWAGLLGLDVGCLQVRPCGLRTLHTHSTRSTCPMTCFPRLLRSAPLLSLSLPSHTHTTPNNSIQIKYQSSLQGPPFLSTQVPLFLSHFPPFSSSHVRSAVSRR